MTFIFTPASHILVVNVCLSEWQLKWGKSTSGSSDFSNCSSLQSRIIRRIALFKVAWCCACPKRLIKIKSEYPSIKLSLYNSDAGTEQLRRMLRHFSQHPFESDVELCLKSAAVHLNMDTDDLRPSCMQTKERFCKVTETQVAELTNVLSDIYPMGLIVYYEEYIKLLQAKIKTYIATM